MEIIKSLTQKIEAEQIRKLQELSSSVPGGQSAGDFLSFGGAPGLHAMNRATSPGAETDFERLVYGKKNGGQAPVNDGFDWQATAPPSTNGSFNPTPVMSVSPARSRSPGTLTTASPKFAWSTPSPTEHMPPSITSMNSVLSHSQNSSINSISALQPTSSSSSMGMGFSTPLQPNSGGFGSTTAFRQQPTANSSNSSSNNNSTGGGLNWSSAMKPTPTFPTSNNRPVSTPSTNLPMNQMMSGLNLGGGSNTSSTRLNGFGGSGPRKGGGIQLTNFGMASTPTPAPVATPNALGGLGTMNLGGTGSYNITPKKNEEKTGLDKWESLI